MNKYLVVYPNRVCRDINNIGIFEGHDKDDAETSAMVEWRTSTTDLLVYSEEEFLFDGWSFYDV